MNMKNMLLIFILVIGMLFFTGSTVLIYPIDDPVENLESVVNETADNLIVGEQIQGNQNGSLVYKNSNLDKNTTTNHTAKNMDNSKTEKAKTTETNKTPSNQENKNSTYANSIIGSGESVDLMTAIESSTPLQSINNSINNITSVINQTLNQYMENETQNETEDPVENQTPPLSPEDPATKTEFNRIAATQYDVTSYNCLNKTMDFHNYILQHGAQDTQLVWAKHQSGDYMHIFLIWNGLVYDPTIKPPCYGVDYDRYINAIRKEGFTTIYRKSS